MAFSTQSCTSINKIAAHEPVGCLGVPIHNVSFTNDEQLNTPDTVLDKLVLITTTYKQRIKTNCELVKSHNKIHEVTK